MAQLLYKGQAIHKICVIHGLQLGVVPDPNPKPPFEYGICSICQIDGPADKVQQVAEPKHWKGLRQVNSGLDTGVTLE